MPENEIFLGDGAYVEWTGNEFIVYTSNGIQRTNQVYLEPMHLRRLIEFYQQVESRSR